jgi:small GTP-binding protein
VAQVTAMSEIPLLKVVIAGDGAVGKTSIVRRYCEGKYQSARVATIGVDFYTQRVRIPLGSGREAVVKLSIWDLAGQERFGIVRSGFYRGSRAAALVYDVTNLASLGNLKRWRDEVLEAVPDVPFVVVGNKVDLERSVKQDLARAAADFLGAPYLETSALSGEGVATLFQSLARLAAKRRSGRQ